MNGLRAVRTAAGIKQRQLAERLGMTPGAIGHYEQGRRQLKLEDARRLVAALNALGAECTLEQVFPPAVESKGADAA